MVERWFSVPHKVLFTGSYSVLEGGDALVLAIPPRLHTTIQKKPIVEENPFWSAACRVFEQNFPKKAAQAGWSSRTNHSFTTNIDDSVGRWGIGSSASFTVSLCLAIADDIDLFLSKQQLFELASQVHFEAQGKKGSGADIAGVIQGGLLLFRDCKPVFDASLQFPSQLGLYLVLDAQKVKTTSMIELFYKHKAHQVSSFFPMQKSSSEVVEAFETGSAKNILASLRVNAECEERWSQETGLPLHTPLYHHLKTHHLMKSACVKLLGAGGGDSVGVFFEKNEGNEALLEKCFANEGLMYKKVAPESRGAFFVNQE